MDWEKVKHGLATLDVPLFKLGSTQVTVATLLAFALILLLTFLASRLLRKALSKALAVGGAVDEGTVGAASRLLHYSTLVAGSGLAVHTLGIDLTAFFAAGALFAVAIGFAMQNLTANFVSGIILLIERAIKPGDILDFNGEIVRVQDMGIRATVAKTLNDEDLVIPNSQLVQSTVRNLTFRDVLSRLRVAVEVEYRSDMVQVREVLERTARNQEWRSPLRDPVVLLTDFGTSSVDFEVSVWVADPWKSRQSRSHLREAIWWALKDAGITIAFPQVDLHLDPPVEASLRDLRRAG